MLFIRFRDLELNNRIFILKMLIKLTSYAERKQVRAVPALLKFRALCR